MNIEVAFTQLLIVPCSQLFPRNQSGHNKIVVYFGTFQMFRDLIEGQHGDTRLCNQKGRKAIWR